MDGSKSFWTSKTLIGLLVAVAAQAAARKGWTVDAEGLTNDVVSLVGVALSAYGRFAATQALHVVQPGDKT